MLTPDLATKHARAFSPQQGYRVLRFWNNEVTDNLEGVLASDLCCA